jgi:hypothetical protein
MSNIGKRKSRKSYWFYIWIWSPISTDESCMVCQTAFLYYLVWLVLMLEFNYTLWSVLNFSQGWLQRQLFEIVMRSHANNTASRIYNVISPWNVMFRTRCLSRQLILSRTFVKLLFVIISALCCIVFNNWNNIFFLQVSLPRIFQIHFEFFISYSLYI